MPPILHCDKRFLRVRFDCWFETTTNAPYEKGYAAHSQPFREIHCNCCCFFCFVIHSLRGKFRFFAFACARCVLLLYSYILLVCWWCNKGSEMRFLCAAGDGEKENKTRLYTFTHKVHNITDVWVCVCSCGWFVHTCWKEKEGGQIEMARHRCQYAHTHLQGEGTTHARLWKFEDVSHLYHKTNALFSTPFPVCPDSVSERERER